MDEIRSIFCSRRLVTFFLCASLGVFFLPLLDCRASDAQATGISGTHAAELVAELKKNIHPLDAVAPDLKHFLESVGEARFVLLGESTHGSEEFYHLRAEITKALILNNGFSILALEADWPQCARLDAFIQGGDMPIMEILQGFRRYPSWMWRNNAFLQMLLWLRQYNTEKSAFLPPVHLYGLDLFGLFDSMPLVADHLAVVDSGMSRRAVARYSCFDKANRSPAEYVARLAADASLSCEQPALAQLREIEVKVAPLIAANPQHSSFLLQALGNARAIVQAENYYRLAYTGQTARSWNLRDQHMTDTMEAVSDFHPWGLKPAKVVVWAHNSHVGNAAATGMGRAQETSIGEIARRRYGQDALLVGLKTASGTVAAASGWNGPVEKKQLAPPVAGSNAEILARLSPGAFYFNTRATAALAGLLDIPRPQRFIGIEYHPEQEKELHYFDAAIASQFDTVFFIRNTQALLPFDIGPFWEGKNPVPAQSQDLTKPASVKNR